MSPRRGLPGRKGNQDASGLLPLTPLACSILLALVESDLHGYGIAQRISARDTGGITLAPGNLYAALDRLIGAGLVERAAASSGARSARRGREYRITPFGREVAALEAARLQALVRMARRLDLLPAKPSTP
jgi:DNA-binding PadR family transcriptional regulator